VWVPAPLEKVTLRSFERRWTGHGPGSTRNIARTSADKREAVAVAEDDAFDPARLHHSRALLAPSVGHGGIRRGCAKRGRACVQGATAGLRVGAPPHDETGLAVGSPR
jgi:hypothetical protein